MVEGHLCPISATVDPKTHQPLSVQTSERRTLMDLAMSGKPKYDILTFLIQKGLSVSDARNTQLASKVLENMLKSGWPCADNLSTNEVAPPRVVEEESLAESIFSIEDACRVCFERQTDVVFTPCVRSIPCFRSSKFFLVTKRIVVLFRATNFAVLTALSKSTLVPSAKFLAHFCEFSSPNRRSQCFALRRTMCW